MANLNTTVNNIQLKSNMIKSGDTATPWTDEYYPSAKAVADKLGSGTGSSAEFPIGSILITSTNENPSTKVGGSWELIDKEFKNDMTPITTGMNAWTSVNANLLYGQSSAAGYIIKANHSTRLKLTLTTTNSMAGSSTSFTLGTFSPTSLGAKSDIPLIAFGTADVIDGIIPAVNSDGTKVYNIQYSINSSGTITLTKIFGNETLPIGTKIALTVFVPMEKTFMADWACDKFYWKRTA